MQPDFKKIHSFENNLINKRSLKDLMYQAFLNYGIVKSSIIADRVKNLTFHFATQSGVSLSVEDLRVPAKKRELIGLTRNEVETTQKRYEIGSITSVEKFQKTIDIWNNANNFLKDDVLTYFRESDPLNPLYIMAFSGARGNISQVRQLVGMRGLMSNPQGQIIDLPRTPKRFRFLSLVPRVERDLPWSLSRPFCLSSRFNLPVDPYRTGEVCLAVVVWCLWSGLLRCYTHSAGRCCRAGRQGWASGSLGVYFLLKSIL